MVLSVFPTGLSGSGVGIGARVACAGAHWGEGGAPEGAAEDEHHEGGDGGEAGHLAPGEAHEAAGGLGRGAEDGLALGIGEGEGRFVCEVRFEPGGEGADFGDGGLLGGIGLDPFFDLLAFRRGTFAEGVGGQLDFIDRFHGRSP